jgi:thiol-disulfide isomerase/thioredoxin
MKNVMKFINVVLLFLFGVMSMSAQVTTPIKGYSLSGTIKGAKDGEKIYISTYGLSSLGNKIKYVNLDSAIINDGRFVFKGHKLKETTIKMPRVYFVRYIYKNRTLIQYPLLIENANIVMTLDTTGNGANNKVTGSPRTESFIEYSKGVNNYIADKVGMNKLRKFTYIHNNNESTPEMKKEAKDIVKESNDEQMKYTANFICSHIPLWISDYLLNIYYREFDQATKDSVKAIMKVKWPGNEYMKEQIALEEYEHGKQLIQNQTPVGSDYKDLAMKDILGMPMKISDYVPKNKVTLVDFWASWCAPCRREIPNIIKLYNQYKDKGFGVISISFDNDAKAWKDAINALHMPWPQMSDLKGWDSEGAKVYGIMSIPYTLLIDQNGKILAKGLRSDGLATELSEILK